MAHRRQCKRIAVIGAGLGGLSAAARLAVKGFEVDVFEKTGSPGGKAGNMGIDGFRFDVGPSLFTLKEVFSDFFREMGEPMENHLELVRLDPITRYFFPDGTVIDSYADRERFAEEIESKTGEKAERVISYLEKSRKLYELTSDLFMKHPLDEISTYLRKEMITTFLHLHRVDAFRSMHGANSSHFRDPRVVQLFDRYATYNGSSPYLSPATFNLIQHVEFGIGAYGVKGGICSITREMMKCAKEKGVRFHFLSEVDSIIVEGGRIKGIVVEGRREGYEIVVSNSDVVNTYSKLMGGEGSRMGARYMKMEPSSSGGVFYWGIKGENPDLLLHNIFFSPDYEKEFGDIWERKRTPQDPTIYVNITSKLDPQDAPPNCENWFVLINVPYDSGQDWIAEMAGLRGRIVDSLRDNFDLDVSDRIAAEGTLDPPGIEGKWSGNKGSIYGISSNSRTSAFRRQANRSREIKGLYFCGGSAHPGGGMPIVVLSGEIASNQIMKYENVF
ncbi:MAG: phytoene desaturase family protein [Thermoplasmatota archaeon]